MMRARLLSTVAGVALALPVAVLLLLLLLSARPAAAADQTDPIAAQALFEEGRLHLARGEFAQACAKLEESQRMAPAAGTAFNLADCYVHIGRLASAWSLFRDVEAEARLADQTARAEVARRRAGELEPILPRLLVQVTKPDERIDVRRDGIPIGRAQWDTSVPVDFGDHVVTALAPNGRAWRTSVHVSHQGELVTVTIPSLDGEAVTNAKPALTASPELTAAPTPPRPSPPPGAIASVAAAPKARSTSGTAAIIAGIGGVGLLALGGGSMVIAVLKYNDADCTGQQCKNGQALAQRTNAQTWGNVATGLAIAGGVAVATGVVLWLGGSKGDGHAGAARVSWRAGLHADGIILDGTW